MAAAAPPDVLARWVTTIPSIRCSASLVTPWTHRAGPMVPTSTTTRFERARFTTFGPGSAPIVARGGAYIYVLGRVPALHAVVLHAGSEAEESDFSAVLGEAGLRAPIALGALASAPRTSDGLGLGSTRAAVERILGAAHAQHTSCGTDVVHYVPLHPVISEADVWFVYRAGRVVAFAHLEEV